MAPTVASPAVAAAVWAALQDASGPQEGLGIQFVLYLFHPSLRVVDIRYSTAIHLCTILSSTLGFFVEISLLFIPVPTGVPHALFPFREIMDFRRKSSGPFLVPLDSLHLLCQCNTSKGKS